MLLEKPLVAKPFSPYPFPMMMKYGGLKMPITAGRTDIKVPRKNIG